MTTTRPRLTLDTPGAFTLDFAARAVPAATLHGATLRDLARQWRTSIESHALGASELRCNGLVRDVATGRPVARISYNGRVWHLGARGANGLEVLA